jgi:hypothetical protein
VSAAGGDDFLSLKFEADLSQVRADLERVEQTPVKVRLEPQQAARPTGGAAQGLTPGEVRYALGQPGGTFGPGLQSLGSEGVRRMQTQLGVRPFDLPELARGNVSSGGRQAASFAGSPASEAFDTRYENRLAGDADRLRREDERRRKEDERAGRGAQRSLSGELTAARRVGRQQSTAEERERSAVERDVGADKRRSIDEWAGYYAREDKARERRQKADDRAAKAAEREAAAVERRAARAEAVVQRQGNAQARAYNSVQLEGRLSSATNDQARAEILRAEAEQYGGEGTIEGQRLLNRANRYQGAYNRYAQGVFGRMGRGGDQGVGGPGGLRGPGVGGGGRLFSLRGIAAYTGAGFVLREGLRATDAYLELQRARGLAGGNQDDLLAAELKFHDTLESFPLFGDVKKFRDFDARTAVTATQRSAAADTARADRAFETRLGIQASRRETRAAQVGENDDFEGRRAAAANRYTDAEQGARREREGQAKLDQAAVEARRGALYAGLKQDVGKRGIEGRLVSYFLDDRIRNVSEGAISQQASGLGVPTAAELSGGR